MNPNLLPRYRPVVLALAYPDEGLPFECLSYSGTLLGLQWSGVAPAPTIHKRVSVRPLGEATQRLLDSGMRFDVIAATVPRALTCPATGLLAPTAPAPVFGVSARRLSSTARVLEEPLSTAQAVLRCAIALLSPFGEAVIELRDDASEPLRACNWPELNYVWNIDRGKNGATTLYLAANWPGLGMPTQVDAKSRPLALIPIPGGRIGSQAIAQHAQHFTDALA